MYSPIRKSQAALVLAALFPALLFTFQASSAVAETTTYYVDCNAGADTNSGREERTPWKTIARANQQTFAPGDSLLLKGGCTWTEGFKAKGSGTSEAPITLGDWGTSGQSDLPKLDPNNDSAVMLRNNKHWVIKNLDLTQHGQKAQAINDEDGKDTNRFSDQVMKAVVDIRGLGSQGVQSCGEACTVRNIRLEGLKVHDGQWNGIYISGGMYQLDTKIFGYVDNVEIEDVESWNNHKAGIEFTSTYHKTKIYPTKNVKVLNSHLHDNGGDGIMMGPVENGLIEGNECGPNNGKLRDARLGCWTWDSKNTVMQFNESHHNVTPKTGKGARDGGGFDCDLGSEDCVIQYNWSHDNQGEGFLLMSYPIGFGYQRGDSHNIHMRYNVGERDAKKLAGAIEVFGGPNPVIIHNNVIYYEPNRTASAVQFEGPGGTLTASKYGKSGSARGYVFNNIFIANGTVNPSAVSNLVKTDGSGTWTFNNNLYYRVEGGFRAQLGKTAINGFAGWKSRGYDADGLNTDPKVVGSLGGGPDATDSADSSSTRDRVIDRLGTAGARYKLQPDSPAVDLARAVTVGLRGHGDHDYARTPVPQRGKYDTGALETIDAESSGTSTDSADSTNGESSATSADSADSSSTRDRVIDRLGMEG